MSYKFTFNWMDLLTTTIITPKNSSRYYSERVAWRFWNEDFWTYFFNKGGSCVQVDSEYYVKILHNVLRSKIEAMGILVAEIVFHQHGATVRTSHAYRAIPKGSCSSKILSTLVFRFHRSTQDSMLTRSVNVWLLIWSFKVHSLHSKTLFSKLGCYKWWNWCILTKH